MIIELNDRIITNEGTGSVISIYGPEIQIQLTNGQVRTITNSDIIALSKGDSYRFDMSLDAQPR